VKTVGAEACMGYRPTMTERPRHDLAAFRVPEPGRSFAADRNDAAAIGVDFNVAAKTVVCEALWRALVLTGRDRAIKLPQHRPRFGIPLRGQAGYDQLTTIATECQTARGDGLIELFYEFRAVGNIPNRDPSCAIAQGDAELLLDAECEGNRIFDAAKVENLSGVIGIPEAHAPVRALGHEESGVRAEEWPMGGGDVRGDCGDRHSVFRIPDCEFATVRLATTPGWPGARACRFPVRESNIQTAPSPSTIAEPRPSAVVLAERQRQASRTGWLVGAIVERSQRRAVPSSEAVRSQRPLGLNETRTTRSPCFKGGVTGLPESTSTTQAVRSSLAVATNRPSGLNAASLTMAPCLISPNLFPLGNFRRCEVPSRLAVTISPRELKAKWVISLV
jgi:hypothetical protein